MSYKPTIVVLGINGALGIHVLNALLSHTFKSRYSLPIRAVTRDVAKTETNLSAKSSFNSESVKFYSANVESGEGLDKAFEGADVVVNLLGLEVKQNKVANAAAAAQSVKLYIPSEFGVDAETTGAYRPLLKSKTNTLEYAEKLGLKTVSIITGVFLEYVLSLPPLVGVNFPHPGQIRYYGSFDVELSGTSVIDIGKVIAFVASQDPSSLPSKIIVSGDTLTPRLIAKAYKASTGIELEQVHFPLEDGTGPALKVVADGPKSPADFLTGLTGLFFSGNAYHKPIHNDFVSKGLFKFTSFQEVADTVLKK